MPNDPFVDVDDLPSLGPLRYLDVRDQASFDAGHAPGAVRVPLDEWDAAAKAADTGFAKTVYWDSALHRKHDQRQTTPDRAHRDSAAGRVKAGRRHRQRDRLAWQLSLLEG